MKRRDQLSPFPIGASVVFWAGMAYFLYTAATKFPWVVAELRRLF